MTTVGTAMKKTTLATHSFNVKDEKEKIEHGENFETAA